MNFDSRNYLYFISGIKASANGVSLGEIGCSGYDEKHESHQETCPFPWAKSPENLFQQETYLTLATIFVILRFLHFIFPTLQRCTRVAWRRYTIHVSVSSLWEHLSVYLHQVIQILNSLKEPCKKSNLQEGAKNAKAWASKSLATVSFGDASSSRDVSVSSAHWSLSRDVLLLFSPLRFDSSYHQVCKDVI